MSAAQPTATILLRGTCTPRQLELTLDSLLGQTEADFILLVSRREWDADSTALLARYADPRFQLCDTAEPATPLVAILPAGAIAHPTWLARLRAALDAKPAANFAFAGCTFFDGTRLSAAPPAPADPPAFLVRSEFFRAGGTPPLDPGDAAIVPDRLMILRIPGPPKPPQRRLVTTLFGHEYVPADIENERPPTLHVVIDTEAEFDWSKPFAPNLTAVSAVSAVASAQAIFDRYGLRPVYLIDYPVASQPTAIAAISAIASRGAAAIGAHLHPWTNPPLDAPIDRRLSFPGNLPAHAEAGKLDVLLETIEQNFGARPLFYKAGRYGLGPNTASLIAARGLKIDFSLMPETDLRDAGGPDFRMVNTIPYRVAGLDLLSVPMTRADVGPLSRWWRLRGWLDTATATFLHVRAFLVRAALLERLTLTPEGVDARLQVVLLQTLLRRGHRIFVLHFHSPSLAAGHTPYVRTEAERTAFLSRIETVCRWFFEDLGGVPGRPWDLLDIEQRKRK